MRPRARVHRGQAENPQLPLPTSAAQGEMQVNNMTVKKALPYLVGAGIVLFFVLSRMSQPKLGVEMEELGAGGESSSKLYLRVREV